VPIGHGNLFWLVLESHGKVMEIDFPKRVLTLNLTGGPLTQSIVQQQLLGVLAGNSEGEWLPSPQRVADHGRDKNKEQTPSVKCRRDGKRR